jgi:hypothetical protein
MQPKIVRCFADSAGVLLAAMAAVMFITNLATANLVQPRDAVLLVSMRTVLWVVGAIGLAVALICLFGKQPSLQMALVLWLATNLLVYQIGMFWTGGQRGSRGYLGNVADAFGIGPDTAYWLLKAVCLYLFIGSLVSLLLVWRENSKGYLKAVCAQCGGHVAYPPQGLGKSISCPHCQATMTLRAPGNLKMSCFFCKEHIEFPAHGLGQKIRCPHCKNDITLKEQASL